MQYKNIFLLITGSTHFSLAHVHNPSGLLADSAESCSILHCDSYPGTDLTLPSACDAGERHHSTKKWQIDKLLVGLQPVPKFIETLYLIA